MSEVENKRKPRALKGTDIYLMTSIIGKIGVRNIARCMDTFEVKQAMQENEGEDEETKKAQIGTLIFYGVVDVLLEKMEKCEDKICRLLANLYDMTDEEVRELNATDYLDMLIDMVKDENFVDFFRHAYESAKRMM